MIDASARLSSNSGLIIAGTVLKGEIIKDAEYMYGPDRNGKFRKIKIYGLLRKSI